VSDDTEIAPLDTSVAPSHDSTTAKNSIWSHPGVKLLMTALSLAAYGWFIGWTYAPALLAGIYLHEVGHLLTMKRCGMKTQGIYMIPVLGAVTVADHPKQRTRAIDALTTLAGPLAGLVVSAASLLLAITMHSAYWGVIATLNALLNAFNLLPFIPFDGGQAVKAMSASVGKKTGLVTMLTFQAGFIAYIVYIESYVLFIFVAFVALVTAIDFDAEHTRQIIPMRMTRTIALFIGYLLMLAALVAVICVAHTVPGVDEAMIGILY
jgi:Zn-dependent protease